MTPKLPETERLLTTWCREAGEIALGLFRRTGPLRFKHGREAITEADREIERLLSARIRARFPEDAIWGEEYGRSEGRPAEPDSPPSGRVWHLDPIDGTLNFALGLPAFCTSVALMDGDEILTAAIYNPLFDEGFTATAGEGARLNGAKMRVSGRAELAEAVVSAQLQKKGRFISNAALLQAVLLGTMKMRRLGTIALEMAYLADARFDALVRTRRAPIPFDSGTPDGVAQQIARHVAGLIRDGDCIQTGIGAIPAAILAELANKNDLGLHSGLIDDGGMALIERGVMTGRAKELDRAQHVTGMALGTAALLEWLADKPDVVFRGADHTHEVAAIREISNFVSINSAVEIDLFGQVNAERVGGRQISGTGGSVDFMRAAKASRGGRSIVAMTATARAGQVSRIVARVELVTALRTDIDLVVTEYGVADLKHASTTARAEALIAIAAPQFRDVLRDQWRGAPARS